MKDFLVRDSRPNPPERCARQRRTDGRPEEIVPSMGNTPFGRRRPAP